MPTCKEVAEYYDIGHEWANNNGELMLTGLHTYISLPGVSTLRQGSDKLTQLVLDPVLARRCPKVVLDYGCGYGDVADELSRRCANGVTIDCVTNSSRQYHHIHHRLPNLTPYLQTGEDPYTPSYGEYDLVLAIEVLEHIVDWQRTLSCLLDCTAQGADVVISAYSRSERECVSQAAFAHGHCLEPLRTTRQYLDALEDSGSCEDISYEDLTEEVGLALEMVKSMARPSAASYWSMIIAAFRDRDIQYGIYRCRTL